MTDSGPWEDPGDPGASDEDQANLSPRQWLEQVRGVPFITPWRVRLEPGTLRALPTYLGTLVFFCAEVLILLGSHNVLTLPFVALGAAGGASSLIHVVLIVSWWLRKRITNRDVGDD